MTGADPALQLEIVGLFRGQVDGWCEGLASSDWRNVAHMIKGSARGIGLQALAAACERAEGAAISDVALLELCTALRDALAALEDFAAAVA